MKLPAYPKYKPSGVEWLGDVPEKWEVKRSDAIVSADRSQLAPEAFADREVYHYSIPVVQETGVGQIENGDSIASAKQVIKKPVVLVSKLNPRKATICLAKPQPILTLCSTEFVALNADNCELGFLEYLTRSELFRQGLDSKVQSVTRSHQRANPADIYKFWNAWPPREEQQIIAVFLDREAAQIDTLVAKNQKLIERLKEKRIALLSHTVTRGLNSKAKLKSSGNDWLGDIPAHWEVLTVRRRAKLIQTGGTPPTAEERYYEDGTVPWFGPGSFGDQIVVSQPVKLLNSSAVKEGAARMFAAGATMVVAIGATLGKVSSLTEPGSCNQQITVIEFDERRVHPRFATYQLKRLEPALRAIAPSATLPILDQGEIADIAIGLPPVPEQTAIAEFLDAETARIDDLVAKVETAVERLQEYRTALITAAVTGKIDVRKESHGK
jgi:type I restriction enzyme S subunit